MKVLEASDLLERMEQLVDSSKGVDLAVAYCCDGAPLNLLADAASRFPVRAIIGLSDFVTTPSALATLSKSKNIQLQLQTQRPGRYHPKAFLFRRTAGNIAWVGSANLTEAAFSMNTELVVESNDTTGLEKWFSKNWNPQSGREIAQTLKSYEQDWKANRKKLKKGQEQKGRKIRLKPELTEGLSWSDFVALILEADAYWQSRYPWSVLGASFSYLETISMAHAFSQRSWRSLDRFEATVLVPRVIDNQLGEWALLGSSGNTRTASRFRSDSQLRGQVQAAFRRCKNASVTKFPVVAENALEAVRDIPGFSSGIGSRLLTLLRPDVAISVNSASRDGWGAAAGMPPTTLGVPKNYGRLLEWLYDQPWMTAQRPLDDVGRKIWPYRAALADSLVYQP